MVGGPTPLCKACLLVSHFVTLSVTLLQQLPAAIRQRFICIASVAGSNSTLAFPPLNFFTVFIRLFGSPLLIYTRWKCISWTASINHTALHITLYGFLWCATNLSWEIINDCREQFSRRARRFMWRGKVTSSVVGRLQLIVHNSWSHQLLLVPFHILRIQLTTLCRG